MLKVLLTGATSGIGKAVLQLLLKNNYSIYILARDLDKLKDFESTPNVSIHYCDLSLDCLDPILDEINSFDIDVLINNAGVGHGLTGILDVDFDDIQKSINTNLISPIKLSRAVIPCMKSKKYGHIINVGSVAGLHNINSSLYGASKAGLHMFSQNLRYELCGSNIKVTEICPGRVDTNFFRAAIGYKQNLDKMSQTNFSALEPQNVAALILQAIQAPTNVNISTIEIMPTDQAVGGIKAISKDQFY